MKDWIIITPEGTTLSPNNTFFENFQVLGFVKAKTMNEVASKLKREYEYLKDSDFEEIWIYPLETPNPFISYLSLSNDSSIQTNGIEAEMDPIIKKIINILKEHFSDIIFDYQDGNSYFFEGFSDALQEIRVDHDVEKISIYDRYISEKHFVYFGEYFLN